MPRSRRIGSRRRASAVDTKSIGMPASRPRSTSRPSWAASRSLRAILSAPLWVNLSGAAGDGGEGGGGADLTGEAGGARRGLRGEAGAIQQGDLQPVPGQVVGDARAERARADDDRVRRVDHRPGRLIGPPASVAERVQPLDDLALGRRAY